MLRVSTCNWNGTNEIFQIKSCSTGSLAPGQSEFIDIEYSPLTDQQLAQLVNILSGKY
jgi:hypothetical protein